MAAFDLFSIGHSNIAAERFIALLRAVGVEAVGDVRSVPHSRFFPWFSAKNLGPLLAGEGIRYLPYGKQLGGRPRDQTLYRDGIADYEAMARQGEFQAGIARLLADAARCRANGRLCLMCAEREPLDCHRCLLVARELAARGLVIGHILHDGTVEPHAATERRLLALECKFADGDGDLSATGDLFAIGFLATGLGATRLGERLTAAYRRRSGAVAHRMKK